MKSMNDCCRHHGWEAEDLLISHPMNHDKLMRAYSRERDFNGGLYESTAVERLGMPSP